MIFFQLYYLGQVTNHLCASDSSSVGKEGLLTGYLTGWFVTLAMYLFLLCMHDWFCLQIVAVPHMCLLLTEARRECQIPWTWTY